MEKRIKNSILLTLLLFGVILVSCGDKNINQSNISIMKQSELQNELTRNHNFLQYMYEDSYFPLHLVDKVKSVLIELCHQIEQNKPKSTEELYLLTHASTERLNDLEEEFLDNDSELESGAAELIAMDFGFIANAYGYQADMEELIATRNW